MDGKVYYYADGEYKPMELPTKLPTLSVESELEGYDTPKMTFEVVELEVDLRRLLDFKPQNYKKFRQKMAKWYRKYQKTGKSHEKDRCFLRQSKSSDNHDGHDE